MDGADLRRFRLSQNMSHEAFARFLGLRAKDAARSIYNWEGGATRVPDSVAQLVRLAERLPTARIMLAGDLAREATPSVLSK